MKFKIQIDALIYSETSFLKLINDLSIAYLTQNNIKKFIERTPLNFHDRGSVFAMKGKVCCNLFII